MSVYTAYMMILAAVTAGLHGYLRDWASAGFILLSCVPFFIVPGLSDTLYLPVERNSPIIGGLLALLVGWFVMNHATQSWHGLLVVFMGGVMILGAFKLVGVIGVDTHAVALELVFIAAMLAGLSARMFDLNAILPPLDDVRAMVWGKSG